MVLFVFLMLYSNIINSQNQPLIDSLLLTLKVQKEDSLKVNVLNDLAWELRRIDVNAARKYANTAKQLSNSLSYEDGVITSMNRLGTIAIGQKEYHIAEPIWLEVLEKEVKKGSDYGIGRAKNQLSIIYRNKGDNKKALDYSLQALTIFEGLKNKALIALISNNTGYLYKTLGHYDESMKYLIRGLEIRKSLGDEKKIAQSYLNIGLLHITLKNYSNSIEYLRKSQKVFIKYNSQYELAKVHNNLGIAFFKMEDYSSAFEHYQKTLQIKRRLNLDGKDPSIYINLGTIHSKNNQMDKALENYLKSLSIQEVYGNYENTAEIHCNIGNIYFKKKFYNKAIDYYKIALDETDKANNKIMLLEITNNLSLCYSQLKQFDNAFEYGSRYIKAKDSIEYTYKNAVAIKADYEEEQKKIELLQKDSVITQVKIDNIRIENERKNIIIYSLLSGTLLLGVLFFAIFRENKQRQKRLVAEKNEEIQQQKIEELLRNQELKSINAMIEGQEGERQRIARDLHDRLGSMLSMVKVHFGSIENHIEELKLSNRKRYKKANELLDNACDEVRKISHDMSSGVLSKFGLIAVLEDLSDTLEESGHFNVELMAHGLEDRLDNDVEIVVYRIIQELVSNILKYAQAKNVTIQLINGRDGLNVLVEDDGIGFDVEAEKDSGMGFKNITSRVNALAGFVNIDSTFKKGTSVSIDIPLK